MLLGNCVANAQNAVISAQAVANVENLELVQLSDGLNPQKWSRTTSAWAIEMPTSAKAIAPLAVHVLSFTLMIRSEGFDLNADASAHIPSARIPFCGMLISSSDRRTCKVRNGDKKKTEKPAPVSFKKANQSYTWSFRMISSLKRTEEGGPVWTNLSQCKP